MKPLRTGALLSIVLGCGVSLAAQAGNQAPAGQPRAQSGNEMTVTGCLQRSAQGGATGTTGVAGAAAAAAPFILTNAAPASAPGGAGSSGQSAAGTPVSIYALDGMSTELTPHVGHKVEITGTIEPASAAAVASASATSAEARKLKVSSVKMVSSDCSSNR